MCFFGCQNWADFLAAVDADLDMPQPDGLVYARVDSDDLAESAHALWRTATGFRSLDLHRPRANDARPRSEHVSTQDEGLEEGIWRLLSSSGSNILADLGLDRHGGPEPRDIAHARFSLAAATQMLAEQGARVAWQVTRHTGQWEDSHTSIVAVYEDPALAVAHANAARVAEEAEEDPDGEWDGPSGWGVEHVILRSSLPEHLLPFASGEKVAPVRPRRLRGEHRQFMVEVPGRGGVSFDGVGCHQVSAAFLCSLPGSKPTSEERCDARGGSRPADIRVEEGHSISLCLNYAGWEDSRVTVVATGPDAAALLDEVVPAILAHVRKERSWEDPEDGDDGEG